MDHYWFKPKHYGFGAYPATWHGWALTAGYIAIVAALSAWLTKGAEAGQTHLLSLLTIIGAVTAIFITIVWRTTEGGWRWRWGKDD